MERNDLSLIAESYEDVKINSYIIKLIEEGKTDAEIEQILIQEGLFDVAKAKWQGFDRNKFADSVKGRLGQLGQKALNSNFAKGAAKFTQGAAKAGQKALRMGGLKGSSLDKGLGKIKNFAKNAPQQAKDALNAPIQKGKTAESSMRAEKYKALVTNHKTQIYNLFKTSVEAKTQTMEGLNNLVEEIIKDYSRIGGVSNISGLENSIKTNVVKKIMEMPYLNFTNPMGMADMFVKEIIDHINKVKTNSNTRSGLEKAHKLKTKDIS